MNTLLGDPQRAADEPAIYRIRVRGRIKRSWSDRFEGVTISTTPPSERPVVTTLHGTLPDQAALVGIINSLHDLRLKVLSVECLDCLPSDNAAGGT
jgi:hypothetical protein